MKKTICLLFTLILLLSLNLFLNKPNSSLPQVSSAQESSEYWFLLKRASNKEFLYKGIPGDLKSSTLQKTFTVKTGIPNKRPTPLPQLLGREYWLITAKQSSHDNPETAPYFLTLDIPTSLEEPYGPSPYDECNGQCNWIIPGAFGLHGVNSNLDKLSSNDPGSSGCIRHRDEDITYLYNLLDNLETAPIKYFVKDS